MENLGPDMHTGRTSCKDWSSVATSQGTPRMTSKPAEASREAGERSSSEPSDRHSPVDTLILDFGALELWGAKFMWDFVRAAPGNQCSRCTRKLTFSIRRLRPVGQRPRYSLTALGSWVWPAPRTGEKTQLPADGPCLRNAGQTPHFPRKSVLGRNPPSTTFLLIHEKLLTASASFAFHSNGGTSLLRNSVPSLISSQKYGFHLPKSNFWFVKGQGCAVAFNGWASIRTRWTQVPGILRRLKNLHYGGLS